MPNLLRVGIIGVSPEGGWAREGHVPALQGLDGLEFAAVATNSQKTADASAKAFGVPAAFGSGFDLIRAPGIDLVTVATRVPDHRDLVLTALAAGKHVYCEWPLGRDVAEAEKMAAAAEAAGVHVAIGLQLRGSPVVERARTLIASGEIGRVLSVRVYGSTVGFGPIVPAPFLYLEEPENFANLITIQGAHAIDLAIALVGDLADLNALTTTQYPQVEAGAEREIRVRKPFDHLLLQSRFSGGGSLSIEIAGGRPPETPFYLDVVGDSGFLRLEGGAARGFQAARITLSVNGVKQPVDEGELASMPDSSANVAGIYAALRDDIFHGTSVVAGFRHAARLTHLLTDVFASSFTGSRSQSANWPQQ